MGGRTPVSISRKERRQSDDFESTMAPLRIIGRHVIDPARDNLHGLNLSKRNLLRRCLGGVPLPELVDTLKRLLRCRANGWTRGVGPGQGRGESNRSRTRSGSPRAFALLASSSTIHQRLRHQCELRRSDDAWWRLDLTADWYRQSRGGTQWSLSQRARRRWWDKRGPRRHLFPNHHRSGRKCRLIEHFREERRRGPVRRGRRNKRRTCWYRYQKERRGRPVRKGRRKKRRRRGGQNRIHVYTDNGNTQWGTKRY